MSQELPWLVTPRNLENSQWLRETRFLCTTIKLSGSKLPPGNFIGPNLFGLKLTPSVLGFYATHTEILALTRRCQASGTDSSLQGANHTRPCLQSSRKFPQPKTRHAQAWKQTNVTSAWNRGMRAESDHMGTDPAPYTSSGRAGRSRGVRAVAGILCRTGAEGTPPRWAPAFLIAMSSHEA